MSDPVVEMVETRVTLDGRQVTIRRSFIDALRRSQLGWQLSDADGAVIGLFADDLYDQAVTAAGAYLAAKADSDALVAQAADVMAKAGAAIRSLIRSAVDPAQPAPVEPAQVDTTP